MKTITKLFLLKKIETVNSYFDAVQKDNNKKQQLTFITKILNSAIPLLVFVYFYFLVIDLILFFTVGRSYFVITLIHQTHNHDLDKLKGEEL